MNPHEALWRELHPEADHLRNLIGPNYDPHARERARQRYLDAARIAVPAQPNKPPPPPPPQTVGQIIWPNLPRPKGQK